MMTLILQNIILAIELPSLRILSLARIGTIALLYVAALYLSVVYVQSIGSNIGVFSDLFQIPELEISNWLLLSSLMPIKPGEGRYARRLKKSEKEEFVLPEDLKQILVGLMLGDLFGQNRNGNIRLVFKQGLIHETYLLSLYELFKNYCPSAPKVLDALPDKRTGKIYSAIHFSTFTLPCFNEIYNLFYPSGVKTVPLNIKELMTPLGLAYWIADDGSFNKSNRHVVLCTDSFTLSEVDLLISVLNDKFNLKCYIYKQGNSNRILIPSYSVSILQTLLAPVMPSMMRHKIGLISSP